MKFAWRLLTVDNVWTRFFAKYAKAVHLSKAKARPTDSRVWKAICQVLLEVYDNCCVKVHEGNISFWFDRWLSSRPLEEDVSIIHQPNLKIKDCWL